MPDLNGQEFREGIGIQRSGAQVRYLNGQEFRESVGIPCYDAQVRYPNEGSNEPISEESLSIWSS